MVVVVVPRTGRASLGDDYAEVLAFLRRVSEQRQHHSRVAVDQHHLTTDHNQTDQSPPQAVASSASHVTSRHVTSRHVRSRHVMSGHVTSRPDTHTQTSRQDQERTTTTKVRFSCATSLSLSLSLSSLTSSLISLYPSTTLLSHTRTPRKYTKTKFHTFPSRMKRSPNSDIFLRLVMDMVTKCSPRSISRALHALKSYSETSHQHKNDISRLAFVTDRAAQRVRVQHFV